MSLTAMVALFCAAALALNATPSGRLASTSQVTQAPTLRIHDAPAREFVAHGVVPVPAGVNVAALAVPEASAEQLEVFASSAAWQLVAVAARVPAGTKQISLAPGQREESEPKRPILRAWTRRPPIRVVIEGHGGARETVELGQGALLSTGPCRWVAAGTAHSLAFGTLRWFARANDLDNRVWLTLRWTNAVDAAGRARPEFLFRSVQLETTVAGARWESTIPDPAVGGGYLVTPADHVFKQRGLRDFRIVVHAGLGASAPDGWGCADWSGGGYLPAGLRVPRDIKDAASAVAARGSTERAAMATNGPTGGASSDARPVSPLWPHAGVSYGGMTGGIDVWPFDGCLTASTGRGLDTHRILATRYGCRQLLIWEPDGKPVRPEAHFVNGGAQWDTFDFVFLRDSGGAGQRDAPWEFDALPKPAGPRGYDPSQIAPIDWQHAIRATKDALALIWLDADPAAIEYVQCMAEVGRMTFWPGPGRTRLALPAVAGQGWEVGRADCWLLNCVAASAMTGRAGMREFAQIYVDGCKRATMPSGLWGALRYGKVVSDPPIGGAYIAHRGNELAYFSGVLRSLEALGLDVAALIESGARGTRDLAWFPGTGGCYDRHLLGPLGGGPLFRTRADAPASVLAGISPDGYYSGLITGSFALEAQYREWLGGQSLANRVVFRGAPIELWLPAVSRWGSQ
ncbi:MAG: hypothetical protein ABL998_00905 [Planctomycetota bacterium]